jgi:pilus assembly protein CpaF
MSGLDIPIKAIREYINNAIDLVVNIERMNDGKRKITSISELDGFIDDRIKLREIFKFNQTGLTINGEVDGEYILYNDTPNVYKKIVARGITDLEDMFK